jgi:hypothetical protein
MFAVIVCSLHSVHKMNAYRADHVYLSTFGTDIMPLEATPILYFVISYNQ